ncbi:MAG: MFS transporter [Desulfobulbaceae bacterium]
MLGAGESYIGPFGIFLQATTLQIGLLATLPQCVESISQWISALALDRYRSRRTVMVRWATIQALTWLPVAALPFLFGKGPQAAMILILLVIVSHVATGVIDPVWSSLMGDLVPAEKRGGFFGRRSRLTGMCSFLGLLLAGAVLHLFKQWELAAWGFAVIFTVASLARLHAVHWMKRYEDPEYVVQPEDVFSFWQFLKRARTSNFAKFVFFFAAMNFGVAFSSPYFALYMLRDLGFSYLEFTSISAMSAISQFLTFRYWGDISDRFGNKKILNVCSWGVGVVPLFWLFSTNLFYLASMQIFAGCVWAGFNLASANFIYDACSPPKRARCVAYRSVTNSVFVLAGSMAGALTAGQVPAVIHLGPLSWQPSHTITLLFLVSGLLRMTAAGVLLRKFHEVREVEHIRSRDLIFRISHIKPIAGATFSLLTYFFRDQSARRRDRANNR